jgi:hypothetical protein
MTDESHAGHRPPVGQDPAEARPPTSFGRLYPENDILAVVEDQATGDQALRALQQAGIPARDMDIMDAAWFLEVGRAFRERRSILQRLAALLAAEEGTYTAEYEEEARQGHPLLVVHAADRATAERIGHVLRGHGARRLRYYARNTVTDL